LNSNYSTQLWSSCNTHHKYNGVQLCLHDKSSDGNNAWCMMQTLWSHYLIHIFKISFGFSYVLEQTQDIKQRNILIFSFKANLWLGWMQSPERGKEKDQNFVYRVFKQLRNNLFTFCNNCGARKINVISEIGYIDIRNTLYAIFFRKSASELNHSIFYSETDNFHSPFLAF